MSNSKVDLSSLTPNIPEVLQDFKDLIKEKSFEFSNFDGIINVVEDIDNDKKVGYIGEMPDIGKKANTDKCKLNEVAISIPTSEETWEPKPFDSRLFFCAEELNNTVAQKLLKKGINKYDITGTDYFEEVQRQFERAFGRMWWRMAWVSMVGAKNVDDSPAGEITAGVDTNLLDISNGLFKRAYDQIAANPEQHIEIAANDESSKELQYSELTPAKALEIANKLYYESPLEIRSNIKNDGMVAYCTMGYHDKLKQYFQGKGLETMLSNLENGLTSLKVNGLDYIEVPELDYMIRKYNDLGTTYKDPHRIILADRNNLLFGVPSLAAWGDLEMWYEKKDKGVYIDFEDKYDTRFAFKNQIMFAS